MWQAAGRPPDLGFLGMRTVVRNPSLWQGVTEEKTNTTKKKPQNSSCFSLMEKTAFVWFLGAVLSNTSLGLCLCKALIYYHEREKVSEGEGRGEASFKHSVKIIFFPHMKWGSERERRIGVEDPLGNGVA